MRVSLPPPPTLGVKQVEALQFFFLLAQISSIVFLNIKNLDLPRTVVCGGGWGGGEGVKTL